MSADAEQARKLLLDYMGGQLSSWLFDEIARNPHYDFAPDEDGDHDGLDELPVAVVLPGGDGTVFEIDLDVYVTELTDEIRAKRRYLYGGRILAAQGGYRPDVVFKNEGGDLIAAADYKTEEDR